MTFEIKINVKDKEVTSDSLRAAMHLISEQLKNLGISHSLECKEVDSKMRLMKLNRSL